jgi:hypothetical protein
MEKAPLLGNRMGLRIDLNAVRRQAAAKVEWTTAPPRVRSVALTNSSS